MARHCVYTSTLSFARETSVKPNNNPDDTMVIQHCNALIEYLEKTHGIQVPSDYAISLSQANANSRKTAFSISSGTIDSIICSCNMWKEFIDIADYNQLVCKEVVSMIRIHSSVISARTFQEDHGISFKKQPSQSFVTIVNNYGKITVYP